MLTRHPTSTLFPYTTLFRSAPDVIYKVGSLTLTSPRQIADFYADFHQDVKEVGVEVRDLARSEEHTSELQSLRHLVCRLLLEKKNRHVLDDMKMLCELRTDN